MGALLMLLAEVTVTFAVALLAARLAAGARAAVRHLILASAFGMVLILPLAAVISPPLVVEISVLPARDAEPVAVTPIAVPIRTESPRVKAASAAGVAVTPRPVPSPSVPVSTWALLVWAVVALFALVPVGMSLWNFQNIRRRSQPWPGEAARLDQLVPMPGGRRTFVLMHDAIAAPIAGGIFSPVVILPADAVAWSEAQLANALLHELEHVRRHDWAVHLATRTICALYWFHPLAWIAWRALVLDAERACDDAVLAREDATAYADQLLELARRLVGRHTLPGLQMASGGTLSSRIKSVLDDALPRGRAGRMMVTCIATAALLAVTALAPLRAAGPLRKLAAHAPPSARPFVYAQRMGLATWHDNQGCLAVFNSAIAAGARVSLTDQHLVTDPPAVTEATVVEPLSQACDQGLAGSNSDGVAPSFYRIARVGAQAPSGWGFAIIDSPGLIAVRDGQAEIDLDGDGVKESFHVCTSIENVHFMVWTGAPAQGRPRWHGNFYVGYDMEPSCTAWDYAGMEALDKTRAAVTPPDLPDRHSPAAVDTPSPAVATAPSEAPSPQVFAASIIDYAQSLLADGTYDQLTDNNLTRGRITSMQRAAQTVVDDDGSDPADISAKSTALLAALGDAANSAAGAALRPGTPPETRQTLKRLEATLHAKSAELGAMILPLPGVKSIVVATPERRAAIAALDLVQRARADKALVGRGQRVALLAGLDTVERAAQSVILGNDVDRSAAAAKQTALSAAVVMTERVAANISVRPVEPAEIRSKLADLAGSLRGIATQLGAATPAPDDTRWVGWDLPDTERPGDLADIDWTISPRHAGPLAIGASISEVRRIINDPSAYLVEALHQNQTLPREPDDSSCAYLMTARIPQQIGLMFQQGRLVRIDVWQPGIRTLEGAQVGDTEARVLDLYGSGLKVTQRFYGPVGAHYMVFTTGGEAARNYQLLFESNGSRVTQFRVGLDSAVAQVEGCE